MAFVTDTFTGEADATPITSHVGETGATWTAHPVASGAWKVTAAGRAYRSDPGYVWSVALASGTPATADYDVEATVIPHTLDGDDYDGIGGRWDATARTGYYVVCGGSSQEIRLYKDIAGTATVLASVSKTWVADQSYALKLELRGTALKVYLDGVEIVGLATTDSSIAAAGRAALVGLGAGGSSPTRGIWLDGFTATDAAPADSTPPTLGTLATNTDGDEITGTLSESGCVPSSGTGGFTLSGTSAVPGAWTISGTTFTLSLSPAIQYGETPLLNYARASTTDDIADAATNYLADFSGASVTNNVPAPPLVAGTVSLVSSGPGGLTVQATDATGGVPPYTYQIERSDNGGAYVAVAGATSLTPGLDADADTPGVAYRYRMVYTDDDATTATSDPTAALYVYEGGNPAGGGGGISRARLVNAGGL